METNLIGQKVLAHYSCNVKATAGTVRGVYKGDKADVYGLTVVIQTSNDLIIEVATSEIKIIE